MPSPANRISALPVPTPAAVASTPGEGAESTNPEAEWRNQQPKAGYGARLQAARAADIQARQRPDGLLHNSARTCRSCRRGWWSAAAATRTRPIVRGWPGSPRRADEGTARGTACKSLTRPRSSGPRSRRPQSMDAMSASVTALTRNFPAALDLLADVVVAPGVPDRGNRASALTAVSRR